jgi:hypothetical protein
LAAAGSKRQTGSSSVARRATSNQTGLSWQSDGSARVFELTLGETVDWNLIGGSLIVVLVAASKLFVAARFRIPRARWLTILVAGLLFGVALSLLVSAVREAGLVETVLALAAIVLMTTLEALFLSLWLGAEVGGVRGAFVLAAVSDTTAVVVAGIGLAVVLLIQWTMFYPY